MKILLGVLGVILVGMAILAISFVISMKPDRDKESAVRKQAEQYIEENFKDHVEIYDTLYDNMGNFEFEYAAKVRDEKNHVNFLVYYDASANQMVDTYIAEKWAGDVEREIRPYIKEKFGESADVWVFYDDRTGKAFTIDPNKPASYKDYNSAPTIRITIPRKKKEEDEQLFNAFIGFMKEEDKLQHGSVIVAYIAENGEILEPDEWSKEF